MTLAPCPVCGQPPTTIMSWITWNVKCETPGCVGYPHPEFLSRSDTVPYEPADAVKRRWNDWAGGELLRTMAVGENHVADSGI